MKRIFTLLLLAISAFSFKTQAQGTTCNAEFAVQFINTNTVKFNPVMTAGAPAVIHIWNFGDGSPANQSVSPQHTYAVPGTYAVVHTVVLYNPNGVAVCTQSFTRQVIITPECNLLVDFSWNSVAASPLTIAFQNLSVPLSPTDSITWYFGDNATSHDVNPVHTYANAGTYNVCLIVKKNVNPTVSPCIKYICKTVVVQTTPPCNLVVDFNWTITQTNPLRYEFHNLSGPVSPTDSVRWTFGDGAAVNGLMGDPTIANPVHTYSQPGTYTVCLRIKRNNNTGTTPCVRDICKTIVIPQPCNLVVDFNWTITQTNPLRFEFHNLSNPVAAADSVEWTFGDGTAVIGLMGNAAIANPVHTYSQPGTYTVCLKIKRNNSPGTAPCVRYICKTVVIPVPCNLQAYFSSQPDSMHLLRIKFTNLSAPILPSDSVRWTFGDGTSVSGLQSDPNVANPTHIYAQAGNYNVCIRVKRNVNSTPTPCVSEFCKLVVVNPPPPCNLQAYFIAQPDTNHPLRIKFTNLSVPILPSDSVRWTFGDGTSVSGLQSDPNVANPTHDYAQAGNYNVCIRVKRNINVTPNPCVSEFCKLVIVSAPPCNIPVNFSWQPDSLNPRRIIFTNLTIPATASATATWTFGDGTSATSWNAVHEYAQPGRYRVCLRIVFGPNCVREKCDSIFIPVPPPPCNNQSNFDIIRSSSNSQTLTFIPAYQSNTVQYTWTFGDGTGSHDMIATHHFAPGNYTVCLTVWRGPNCASTNCRTVQIPPQINCDSAHVTYTYQADPQVPNKIHFFANSNFPILDQTWTITRLPAAAGTNPVILHQNNPVYLFQDTGYFRVCLRAVTLGGCVKEYCSTIHITQVANACVLQAFPNPATSTVSVNVTLTQPGMIDAYMYNSQSVLVREKHQQGATGANTVTFAVNDLPAGSYTIKLIYGNHVCYAPFQKL